MLDAELFERTLPKVLLPAAAIVLVLTIARARRVSLRDVVGLKAPSPGAALLWIAIYIVFMLASDRVMGWRGPWDFTIWREQPLAIDAMRVLAVGILGPIAEELIFRGVLFGRLAATRMPMAAVIAVIALGWAVLHYSYSGGVIALIFVGGLLLGAARWRTGSVVVPILMHIAWNLYAVW
jgi:membrane protease YdiL (CAAX protease family)